jgi:hypothetical protein
MSTVAETKSVSQVSHFDPERAIGAYEDNRLVSLIYMGEMTLIFLTLQVAQLMNHAICLFTRLYDVYPETG